MILLGRRWERGGGREVVGDGREKEGVKEWEGGGGSDGVGGRRRRGDESVMMLRFAASHPVNILPEGRRGGGTEGRRVAS